VDLWYRTLGDLLTGRRTSVPAPDPPDSQLPGHLVGHLRTGLDGADAAAGRQALLLLWGAQHLDSLRRAEPSLTGPAAAVATRRRIGARLLGTVP
jgi:hypothetical protein